MRKPNPRKVADAPLKTVEVASILGISQRTLLRKLADGTIDEPTRAANNYRLWRPENVQAAMQQLQREKTA